MYYYRYLCLESDVGPVIDLAMRSNDMMFDKAIGAGTWLSAKLGKFLPTINKAE